jgi:hypothetical protein
MANFLRHDLDTQWKGLKAEVAYVLETLSSQPNKVQQEQAARANISFDEAMAGEQYLMAGQLAKQKANNEAMQRVRTTQFEKIQKHVQV